MDPNSNATEQRQRRRQKRTFSVASLQMDDPKALIDQVFGESSDGEDLQQLQSVGDDSDGDECQSTFGQNARWEQIDEINGLWLCTDFLSPQLQSSLLSAIQNESVGLFSEGSHNQAMRFGDLPKWAIELSNSIRDCVFDSMEMEIGNGRKEVCLFPADLLWREPLFDQLIVNVYQPGEGICAHVDLMRFEDGIAIVSLESSCVMHFSLAGQANDAGENGNMNEPTTKIPIHLTPGSLVLMSGEARYLWKHEINRNPGFQMWEGEDIDQKRRTSITLRKLCQAE